MGGGPLVDFDGIALKGWKGFLCGGGDQWESGILRQLGVIEF